MRWSHRSRCELVKDLIHKPAIRLVERNARKYQCLEEGEDLFRASKLLILRQASLARHWPIDGVPIAEIFVRTSLLRVHVGIY